MLKLKKNKELTFDPRSRSTGDHSPGLISSTKVEQATSFKYFCVHDGRVHDLALAFFKKA